MKPIFFDTSVLLGGLIEVGPEVAAAQAIMNAIAEGRVSKPVTAWHCCLELYSVATRLPLEYRLSPHNALLLMEEEIFRRFDVHQLPEKSRLPLLRSAVNHQVAGGRIYDTHIGAIAFEAGVSLLVTENVKHFDNLPAHGIDVLEASEFLPLLKEDSV